MTRLQLITTSKHSEHLVNSELKDFIADGMAKFGDTEIVDTSPDVVHIFGMWTAKSARAANDLQSRGIPVVFTAINGMAQLFDNNGEIVSNIALRNAVRQIARHTILHCGGIAEEKIVTKIARRASTTIITNALTTSTTDTNRMLQDFHDLYAELYKRQEQTASGTIQAELSRNVKTDDCAIRDICSRLLYLKYLYKKNGIRKEVLDEVSTLMIASNYDEAVMRNTLEALHLRRFAASCMALLEKESTLTEGFMPIDATEDKTLRRMQEMIIQ